MESVVAPLWRHMFQHSPHLVRYHDPRVGLPSSRAGATHTLTPPGCSIDAGSFALPTFDADPPQELEKDYVGDDRLAAAVYANALQCTNFTCCGLTLADLHELVGHFEEQHVTVVGPAGVPFGRGSPPPLSSSSGSASPCTPHAFPMLTSGFPPRESAFAPVMTSGSRDPGGYLAQNCLAKEEEHVFDTMVHSEVYDHASSGGVVPEDTMSYENTNYETCYENAGTSRRQEDAAGDSAVPLTHVYLPTVAPTPVHARPPTLSIVTEPERTSWGERRKKGRRERMHKCPHEGCIKVRIWMRVCVYVAACTECVVDVSESERAQVPPHQGRVCVSRIDIYVYTLQLNRGFRARDLGP